MNNTRANQHLIIVAAMPGGQGKTLLAGLIASFRRADNPLFRAIAADSLSGGQSKLASMIEGADDLGGETRGAVSWTDPCYWDPLYAVIAGNGASFATLLDVGAGMAHALLSWAELSALPAGAHIDLVVPIVASPTAVAQAHALVTSALRPGVLPMRSLVIIENGVHGAFAPALRATPEYKSLVEMAQAHGAGIITIPRCNSILLREAELGAIRFCELLDATAMSVAQALDMPLVRASRELRAFQLWIEACRDAFAQAELLTPPQFTSAESGEIRPVPRGPRID